MHWWMNARDPMSAWTHFAWMFLAIPGTLLLLWLSRKHPVRQASMVVFGLSLIFSMFGSFLYHAVPLADSPPFEALDHVGIYVLIAGTVTAIAVIGLRGWWRVGLLIRGHKLCVLPLAPCWWPRAGGPVLVVPCWWHCADPMQLPRSPPCPPREPG